MRRTTIRNAAVIGSGVMGAGIAAHLANAGLRVLLLDRGRLAEEAIGRLKKSKPPHLYERSLVERITPGSVEDDFHRLKDADWIIEAVTERLDLKKELFARIERVWTPGAIVSSNTSGISIRAMAEAVGPAMRSYFAGTHFFNPPRYMPLVEVIPGPETKPEIVASMTEFLEAKLGKGVVIAKDTPNFIANRIGTYGLLVTLREMLEKGYSVEEVDAVTGPALGRPKSATFRTLDLVGLDTFIHVANNVYEHSRDEDERRVFETPEPLAEMVRRGWLGEKSGQGFYKKIKSPEGSVILSLSLTAMDYGPQGKIKGASLDAAKAAKGAAAKCRALVGGGDRYSQLAWDVLKHTLLYAADKIFEIADSIADVDKAMRLGFNWDLGPFEVWDAIGLRKSVLRMEAEGLRVPDWVKMWLEAGNESFYSKQGAKTVYVQPGVGTIPLASPEQALSLKALKAEGKTVLSNSGASLIDIGADVACLEFHSPNNAIGADILTMIHKCVEEVRRNYRGMVIANEGRNFCVGANLMLLLMEAQEEEWDEVDRIIRMFQNAMLAIKRLEKPVVAAPHRMTLGGGVEVCMAADRVYAHAETYYGLVEAGVGLIPAGGGTKEMAKRSGEAAGGPDADLQPAVNRAFETIGMAKVSSSGPDAASLGLLRAADRIAMNRDRQLFDARSMVLELERNGYEPGADERIRVTGVEGKTLLKLGAYTMKEGGYISAHDYKIAEKLAHVLAGGDVPSGTFVTEQYMLDLEREAFLSLCGERKTQDRMKHMLATGKPLRN